jgi:hypothetical protein
MKPPAQGVKPPTPSRSRAQTRATVWASAHQTLAPDDEQEPMATPLLLDDCRRRVDGPLPKKGASPAVCQSSRYGCCQKCCHGPSGSLRSGPHKREKPCRAGPFKCAEEDSNLHPVSLDQALNLVTRVSYPSGSRQIVRIVPERGRYGRIGRSRCCRGCCHEPAGLKRDGLPSQERLPIRGTTRIAALRGRADGRRDERAGSRRRCRRSRTR